MSEGRWPASSGQGGLSGHPVSAVKARRLVQGLTSGAATTLALLCLSLVGTASAAATTSGASSQNVSKVAPGQMPAITVSPGNWIHYNNIPVAHVPTKFTETRTVKGVHAAGGGCRFGSLGTVPSGVADVVEEETAYNPTTCESVVLRAGVDRDTMQTLEAGASTEPSAPAPTASEAFGPGVNAASTPSLVASEPLGVRQDGVKSLASSGTHYASGHTRDIWRDPLGINITSLIADLSWPLHEAAGPVGTKVYSYEFSWDHWTNSGQKGPYLTKSFGLYPNSTLLGNKREAEVSYDWIDSAHETFFNKDFAELMNHLGVGLVACPEVSVTAEFYHNIKVLGYQSDATAYWTEDSKKGDCSNLVHHVVYAGWGWDGPENEYVDPPFVGIIASSQYEQESEQTIAEKALAPSVMTTAATPLKAGEVSLNGATNPEERDTTYDFEYGSSEAYGANTAVKDAGSGTSLVYGSATLGGLPSGVYHYRMVATNSAGTSYGADQTFIVPEPPGATTGGTEQISSNAATVGGTVNPNGANSSYYFEFGEAPGALNRQAPAAPGWGAGAGSEPVQVATRIEGLAPCTSYRYRLEAGSSAGAAFGSEQSLLTHGLPAASLRNIPESWVQYGPTNAYISATEPCGGAISSLGMQIPAGGATFFSQSFSCGCEENVTSGSINLSGQPTGIELLGGYAEDPFALRREASPTLNLYVDHTPPSMSLSGSALEAKEGQIGEGLYTLSTSAVDGSTSSPQIGSAEVWVEADGVRQETWKSNCSRPRAVPAEGCFAVAGTWTFSGEQLGVGQHTITVRAKDWLANESTRTLTLTVHAAAVGTIGAGQVNLVSGDYALAADDLPSSGGSTGLSVGRAFNSRRPTAGAGEVLGAGWQLSLSEAGVVGWRSLAPLPNGSVAAVSTSGQRFVFAAKEGGGFVSPPTLSSAVLSGPSGSPATYRLTDAEGNVTAFVLPSGGTAYLPSSIERPGGIDTVTYSYGVNEVSKAVVPTRVLGGVPAGVSCVPTMKPGCRALTFNYASSTTATGEETSQWGDYAGQLTRIYVEAYDPEKKAMATRTVAQYTYDSHGRLRGEWDPLITPTLETTYGYDPEGHLTSLTPPAQEPWRFEYATVAGDSNKGRLASVSRYNPELGRTATETVHYGVLVAAGGPNNFEAAQLARWSQTDAPVTGTAIFPADEVPAQPPKSYQRANIVYLDALGRNVDDARSGEGVEVREYETKDNPVRKLSAANRATALEANGESAAKSKLLDTELSYNTSGSAPAGSELTETLGPQHNVVLSTGSEVQARNRVHYEYDAGEPGSGPHFMVTKTTEGAQYSGGEADVRTDTRSYSGQSGLGWKLREPTATAIGPESLNLVRTEALEATTGAPIESSTPAASSAGLKYLLQFGASGSGEGQFSSAKGIAVSSTGGVFVADSANNRVQEFSATGAYQQTFGPTCSKTSGTSLSAPAGVAVDTQGNVWVLDTGNSRIVEYSSEGACLAVYGQKGSAAGQFERPEGIAADQFGNLWVADTGNQRIQEISPSTGKALLTFGSKGTGEGQFEGGPTAIALDAQGDVWASDTGNYRLQEFSAQGKFARATGTKGAGEGQFSKGPAGITVSPDGSQVSVLDPGNGRIETFNAEGHYSGQSGSEGTGGLQLKSPTGVASDAIGDLFVMDSGNSRVQELRPATSPLGAHTTKTVDYSAEANATVPTCGLHPEWAGLPCQTGPLAQPETTGVSNLPSSTITYGFFDEPQEVQQVFSSQANMVQNPSFEYGLTGWSASPNLWVASGAKLTKATVGESGKASLEISTAGNANEGVQSAIPGVFKAGVSYTASIFVQGAKAATGLQLRLGDPVTNDSALNSEVAIGGSWTRQSVTWTPRTTTTYAVVSLTDPHTGALAWDTDAVQVTVSPKVVGYADGDQTGSSWAGKPGESATLQATNTRTMNYSYDSSGRLKSAGGSANFGTALPSTTYEYSLTNGLLSNVVANQSEKLAVSYSWNKLGELISYKDSTGINSESRYDIDGRLSSRGDGAGAQNYTYSGTTGKLGTLTDTSGMNFTAEYTSAGQLKSVGYPNGMTATYNYDPTGEKTAVEYVKNSNCGCRWYTDAVVPTIHGQWAKQTSTFSKQAYSYDAAGRLTQVQNTPAGEGCTTHAYHYDQDGNRITLTTISPNSKGECASAGGTNEAHWYDAADRLIDDGTVYDPAGDLAALPGADNTGGANLASAFYSDSKLDSQSEEGETTGYLLDPEQRPRETVLSGLANATITTHYAGSGYRPSWTVTEPGGEWVRDIYGIEGNVAAIETNGQPTSLEIANLHGDVIATASPSATATTLASTADATEFGVPTGGRPPKAWWLGAFGLTTQEYSGTLMMGGRAYQPQLGRFMQPNSNPAGSEDAYSYLSNDPVDSRDPSGEGAATSTNTAEAATTQTSASLGLAPFTAVQPPSLASELTEAPTATPLAANSPPSILTPEALGEGKQW